MKYVSKAFDILRGAFILFVVLSIHYALTFQWL